MAQKSTKHHRVKPSKRIKKPLSKKTLITERVSPKIPKPGSADPTKHSPAIPVFTKILTQAQAFSSMIRAATRDNCQRFNPTKIVLEWWSTAFPMKPFPEGGINAQEAALAIHYQLAKNGYEKYSVKPPSRFLKNYEAAVNFKQDSDFADPSLRAAERLTELSQITIYKNTNEGETIMATKKANKKATKKTTNGNGNNGGINAFVCDLIMQDKYTNEEIVSKAAAHDSEAGSRVTNAYVNAYREAINEGKREKFGYPKPKKPLQEIGGEEKPAPAKKAAKKAEKKAEKKTAKKPAKKAKKVAKKKS